MTAQTAQLTSASTITWVDTTPFNGYALLIMALPSTSGAGWTRAILRDTRPRLRVPTRVKVPIREGVYDVSSRVWFTSSLVPTQVKYASFFYDATDRLIANGPSLFSITATPYTLAPPTLTDPTAAVVAVGPEDVPSTLVTTFTFGVPPRIDLVGTKNGINVLFTANALPVSMVMVIWNGMVLEEGVGYTRSGLDYTLAFAPESGDSLEAVLW